MFSNVDGRATRLRAQLEAVVNDALPGRRFLTSISQAVVLPEVSGRGRTLFQLPRFASITVAVQYLRLSVELEHRVRRRSEFLAGCLPPPDFRVLDTIMPAPCVEALPVAANG